MLAEMGIPVFLPPSPPAALPAEAPPPVEVPAAVPPVATAAARPALREPPAATPVQAPVQAPVVLVRDRVAGVGAMDWPTLQAAVAECQACKLSTSRHRTVFGVGDPHPDWLIVGEAPGENEDLQGEPFVGAAGQLLDNMLAALGISRSHKAYIANVLKCRPPGNRNPEPAELAQCEPFLRRQVELLQPKVILAMGRFAVNVLLQSTEPIGRLRGRPHAYDGVPVVVTYHPAYLLRNLPDKSKAWADLCLARQLMLERPPRD